MKLMQVILSRVKLDSMSGDLLYLCYYEFNMTWEHYSAARTVLANFGGDKEWYL